MELWVCPLLAPSCLQQRSVGRGALSPGCSVAGDRRDQEAINDDLQTALVNLSEWEKVHFLHSDVHVYRPPLGKPLPLRFPEQTPDVPKPPPPNKLRDCGHESREDGHIGRWTMTRGGVARDAREATHGTLAAENGTR